MLEQVRARLAREPVRVARACDRFGHPPMVRGGPSRKETGVPRPRILERIGASERHRTMRVDPRVRRVGYAPGLPANPRCREGESLNRVARATLVALLVAMLAVVGAVAPVAAAARVPRVVLVVGPVGGLTSFYRGLANEAASEASAAGAEVDQGLLPQRDLVGRAPRDQRRLDRRLPRPRQRLAEPVSRLPLPAHPERVRAEPLAGGDDSSHQYFGESSVDNVKLAPNAVVLLSHLCYASGNSEPGLRRGDAVDGHPARRQLRRRVHPRGRRGGRRRGPHGARLLRAPAPPQPGLDRADLARLAEQQRQHDDAHQRSARRASPSGSTRTARAAASTGRSCRRASAPTRCGPARPARSRAPPRASFGRRSRRRWSRWA